MKQSNRRILGIVAASALTIGTVSAVLAHGGAGPGAGQGWNGQPGMMGGPNGMMGGPNGMRGGPNGMMGGPGRMMGSDPVAHMDQRLTAMKSRLGITPEQEPAWDDFATALRSGAAMMGAHRQAMMGGEPVTQEQRLAFRQQGMGQMQQMAAAGEALYQALTPEQRSRAGRMMQMHRQSR